MVTMAKYWTKIRILSSLAFSVLLFAVVLPGQYPSVHSPRQWQGSPPYWILYFSLPFKRVASIILILSKWSSLRWGLFVQYFQKASGVISNSRYRILSRLPTFITFAKQYHLWCLVSTNLTIPIFLSPNTMWAYILFWGFHLYHQNDHHCTGGLFLQYHQQLSIWCDIQ